MKFVLDGAKHCGAGGLQSRARILYAQAYVGSVQPTCCNVFLKGVFAPVLLTLASLLTTVG